ncbi:MAG: hypothetical protein FWH46_06105 [Methanimicrococcus sp.]|nr:hypothetical protein [Methanimicrococcus sp.]
MSVFKKKNVIIRTIATADDTTINLEQKTKNKNKKEGNDIGFMVGKRNIFFHPTHKTKKNITSSLDSAAT